MMKPSFNSWIKFQTNSPDPQIAKLATAWVVIRGRLTSATVEKRAVEYGCVEGTGSVAYLKYLQGLAPFVETPPDDSALLSLDPTK